jgi:hypothetical protein
LDVGTQPRPTEQMCHFLYPWISTIAVQLVGKVIKEQTNFGKNIKLELEQLFIWFSHPRRLYISFMGDLLILFFKVF